MADLKEKKNITGSDYQINECAWIAVDRGASGPNEGFMDLLYFILDQLKLIFALRGRSSPSNPCLWNSQPGAVKVL